MKKLFVIRMALLFGVLSFAGLTVYMRQAGNLPEPDAAALDNITYMRYAVWALSVFSVGWAAFWKTRAESAMSEQGVVSSMIIGWAPGEGTALLGAVSHFVGGPVSTLVSGLVAFIVVLLVLRIPAART